MDKIKTPKLDASDFNERTAHVNSKESPSEIIERGMGISVQQNGFEISLVVTRKEKDFFIGKIIKLNAPKDEYKDLKVGDKIKFIKENICSAPYNAKDA